MKPFLFINPLSGSYADIMPQRNCLQCLALWRRLYHRARRGRVLPRPDGGLNPKEQKAELARLAYDLFRGTSDASSKLVRIPADGLEIRGTKPIRIDGNLVGYSPARIKSVPDFARIIV